MALVFADRVKVRSNSTGTGAFTLDETVYAHQSFDAIGDGNETYYGIVDNNGNWEIGRGTYTAPDQLSRDIVQSSSNNDEPVNFPAGGKNVFVTFPASLAGSISESVASDSFKTIAVSGQSSIVADSSTDTLTLVAGSNITLTTNATTDTITINSTASGGSSFDQDLNTTDQVTFDKVTTGVVETATVGSLDTLDLSAFNNIEVISVGGDVNLTGAGVSIVVGINDKTWDFGADGVLTFPDGSTQSTAGGGSGSFDQNLNTTDNVTFNSVTTGLVSAPTDTFLNLETSTTEGALNSWVFGTDGTITFPDATVQTTAFLGGTPTELNDEENGNKLIINSNGDVIFTDASGTLETPSGAGVDRGIFWDFGVVAGGTDSYIRQTDGGLWIHPFTTDPESGWGQGALNVLVGDPEAETPTVWSFEAEGGMRFPDDTVQTTAYPGQQLEIDGGTAFTEHSIADLEIDGGGA